MIELTIPAIPVAQPRQRSRVARINGKTIAQNYTPSNSPANQFKSLCKIIWYKYSGERTPIDGPLSLSLLFVMPRPQAKRWKTKPMPRYPHTTKPDIDNLAKCLIDGLNGLAWHDDSQICELNLSKCVASGDEAPHVEFRLERLSNAADGKRTVLPQGDTVPTD